MESTAPMPHMRLPEENGTEDYEAAQFLANCGLGVGRNGPSKYDRLQGDLLASAYDWHRGEIARLRALNRKLVTLLVVLLVSGTFTWLASLGVL